MGEVGSPAPGLVEAELALQRDGLVGLAKSGQLTGKDEGYFPL